MERSAKSYIFQVLSITAVVITTGFLLFETTFESCRYGLFPFIPLFFGLTVTALYLFLVQRSRTQPAGFIRGFLVATGIKLLVYLVILVLMLLLDRQHTVSILVTFLIMYVIYTLHEVVSVLRYLKKHH